MAATKHRPPMTYTPGLVSVAKVFCRFRRSVEFAMCSCDGGRVHGLRIADFGLRILGPRTSVGVFSIRNPKSAIRNQNCPPESDPSRCLVQAIACTPCILSKQ